MVTSISSSHRSSQKTPIKNDADNDKRIRKPALARTPKPAPRPEGPAPRPHRPSKPASHEGPTVDVSLGDSFFFEA
jgi:hypothetical protein